MSRIVRFHQTGGPEVLKIENVEMAAPKAGEVRIAVKSLGLNRAESMFRLGQYLEPPQFPGASVTKRPARSSRSVPALRVFVPATPSALFRRSR